MAKVLTRMFRGISEHGLKLTAIHALDFAEHYWFDVRYGTDTASFLRLENLNVVGENKKHGGPYMPTRGRPFRKLMETLKFPPGSVFVDLGCGKGKVVLMATEYGFKRVVGVEFSSELIETTKRNVDRFWSKKQLKMDCEIVLGDVAEYQIKDDENVFFLYNSFGPRILGSFLDNLESSLGQKPRPTFLIYYNPVHAELVQERGIFPCARPYTFADYHFIVYTTAPMTEPHGDKIGA